MSRAVATFVNDVYEEGDAVELDGIAPRRVHIERRFSGTLEGREGSFVLSHRGTVSAAGATTAGEIVPWSGSGGLEGLEGTAEIVVEDGVHRLVLEYGL